MNPIGALCGIGLSTGILAIISARRTPAMVLIARIAPYVSAHQPTGLVITSPAESSLAQRIFGPFLGNANRFLDRMGSTSSSVRVRLAQLPGPRTLEAFRLEQVTWAGVALATALAMALPLAVTAGVEPVALVIAVMTCAIGGALGRDQLLSAQVKRRRHRLLVELPIIAELLALAVGAGESPMAALDRVSRTSSGELAGEIRTMLSEVRTGASLTEALKSCAHRIDVVGITRFTTGITVAIERGSPLAQVLRAQATDAREQAKQDLMEEGGRREIGMLVPVVFLVLPLTVLFALFPGIALLEGSLGS